MNEQFARISFRSKICTHAANTVCLCLSQCDFINNKCEDLLSSVAIRHQPSEKEEDHFHLYLDRVTWGLSLTFSIHYRDSDFLTYTFN